MRVGRGSLWLILPAIARKLNRSITANRATPIGRRAIIPFPPASPTAANNANAQPTDVSLGTTLALDEARRIASNIAKLPRLLAKRQGAPTEANAPCAKRQNLSP